MESQITDLQNKVRDWGTAMNDLATKDELQKMKTTILNGIKELINISNSSNSSNKGKRNRKERNNTVSEDGYETLNSQDLPSYPDSQSETDAESDSGSERVSKKRRRRTKKSEMTKEESEFSKCFLKKIIKKKKKSPTLINTSIYCIELERWVPGPRFRLNGKTVDDYVDTLQTIIKIVKRDVPTFSFSNLQVFAVDFEQAHGKAVGIILGDESYKLKGCEVHWMRSSERIARRVCGNAEFEKTFLKIAQKIPRLEDGETVYKFFDVLTGKKPIDDIHKMFSPPLNIAVGTSFWKCENWANFFWQERKEKHGQKH